ncbi:putative bifunctional diguanylate cyclase/phosphodiesterase [Rhizobium halophytocola]|uniref:Diguanylate cyclase (GGDEF)-like protein n=1 Tax=Rhizobium halophytocola TaxID=735519 RepID=A0ABS4DTE8_9HYPH|nr:EAL domain-containing protein [Rhizobium halophytocola]MBP1848969.1 diguanylate cyclase (GGDEF)-like protein [Rhizobium halophytocola]
MKVWSDHALPPEVRQSLVGSLFANRATLLTGVLVHVFVYLVVFHKTADPFFIALCFAILAIFLYRAQVFLRFGRADKPASTAADAWRWERRYLVGATLTAATLGIGCGYAVYGYADSFVELACISVTLASMVSIVGRNYGSERAVDLQCLACCLPIIVGALGSGDLYMILLSLLLLPFILTTRLMAAAARDFLAENVIASRQMKKMVDSFDTALNNMTHGLIMLDPDSRIQVINRKACHLLRLGDRNRLQGCALEVALEFGARDAAGPEPLSHVLLDQIRSLGGGAQDRVQMHISDELILEFSANRRPEGGVVLIFEDVTARITAERRVLDMVRYDSLTGLPLRDHFIELVGDRMGDPDGEAAAGLMLLDVDGFRHVNDLKGHLTGDELLIAIARRLKSVLPSAPVARLVGDQFVVFLLDPGGADGLTARMEDLRVALGQDYDLPGSMVRVKFSAGGLVGAEDDDRLLQQEWRRRLDLALFESKARGGNSLTMFTCDIDARYVERQRLEDDLRQAVAEGALTIVYQPVYTADGTRIDRCEALARWHHPVKGHIAPNIFIPIAEEIGIISDVTRVVMEQACRDCMTWPEPVSVSVNLSSQDLRDERIVEVIRNALASSGLSASRLHVEITETSLMEEIATARAVLDRLQEDGLTIAIDDFGTGFSSLSYLDRLPAQVVKIDRSFVLDIANQPRRLQLLQGIVQLTRRLGLEIVVEGIETEDQLALVNKHKCADFVQGFVYSTPIQGDRIADLVEQARRKYGVRGIHVA